MADDTEGTSKESAEPTGGEQSSAEAGGADTATQRAAGGEAPESGEVEQAALGDEAAEGGTRPAPMRAREGMFGIHGTGDTSGFGGLRLPGYAPAPAERPFGGWFDEFADDLAEALAERGVARGAVQQITIDRGEITFYVQRERILDICRTLRDDEGLRFELCSSISGVDYGAEVDQRLHVVYHLTSMTYRRRIRLEVALDVEDPHLPSVVEVYPTADWHEREAWDMFGVIFDGHPALTRILMPDDWDGHPQRKDYPLGGIPVEYKGAEIPPPDERRSYS
ncbi:MAG: NADH-quinone oxidoreductase subunit [Pseudonocardiales bacterium]|jgi:NADH-quinone oxidoreductase subunit C|uniref:NADH-quinone oxidoreductase subunit C n=1 Tax=Pseudonocardia sp. TaxID=60912 RepID=UPI00261CE174|nr:NADH-quinone oxidoreductase subunit C [Pseudonocardia sp.]MCW2717971.1 dehydrogenase subunit [Pseudonocardia sp.]MDT7618600.1 NADH-quinone oxidoreductase subunit [Pseudonocardiales bacterium]MDT7710069.1 NADH-quinone oxidoreductase subunit [Pseudonocardiales bacterium]